MNKKTTKKPVAHRTKVAAKSRIVSKSKTAAPKKARKTAVVAKKTTQRKGIKHHAKRIYRLTPKFVHGMVAGAFVGVVLVTSLGISGGVNAASPQADACIKTDGPINVNNANANVSVKLDAGCGKHKFVMKSYYAPDALGGVHGSQQVLFDVTNTPVTLKPSDPWTKIHVRMFDNNCFYQVDLVDVTNDLPKNPIVKAAVGGNKDCRPDQTHAYACTALGLTPGDERKVTISKFTVATTNATFTGADVSWGDGVTASGATVEGLNHQYAADNTYTVSAVAHFTYVGQFGKVHNVTAPPCTAQVTYTTIPNTKMIFVCEISTKRILNIDEKLYGTPQYPLDKYTTDLDKCVVTTVTTTPPVVLANTGPGAVLIVLGLSILGGYAFHMRHRHVQRKKPTRHHAPHHAK